MYNTLFRFPHQTEVVNLINSDFVYEILSVEKIQKEIASIFFKELCQRRSESDSTRPLPESLLFALLTIDLYLWVLEEKGIQGDEQVSFLWKEYVFSLNNEDGDHSIFEVCPS